MLDFECWILNCQRTRLAQSNAVGVVGDEAVDEAEELTSIAFEFDFADSGYREHGFCCSRSFGKPIYTAYLARKVNTLFSNSQLKQ